MMKPISIQAITDRGTYFARWYRRGRYENTIHLMKMNIDRSSPSYITNNNVTIGIFRVKTWKSQLAKHQKSKYRG